jgi:hypothetical protein
MFISVKECDLSELWSEHWLHYVRCTEISLLLILCFMSGLLSPVFYAGNITFAFVHLIVLCHVYLYTLLASLTGGDRSIGIVTYGLKPRSFLYICLPVFSQ